MKISIRSMLNCDSAYLQVIGQKIKKNKLADKFYTIDRLHTKSGFTLIELLVVIAIISLLVSILLPSLNKAKDLAKKVMCASNIKSVGIGFGYYAADFDGYYPAPLGQYSIVPWDVRIQSYLDSEVPVNFDPADHTETGHGSYPLDDGVDVFQCPADKIPRHHGRAKSYSMSGYSYNTSSDYYFLKAFKVDGISNSGALFLLSEWHSGLNVRLWNQPGTIINDWYYLHGNPGYTGTFEVPIPADGFHDEGGNFLFLDSHVEWMHGADAQESWWWYPK